MKIVDYILLGELDQFKLVTRVNNLIEEGYVPHGGIVAVYEHNNAKTYYSQAMIKYETKE